MRVLFTLHINLISYIYCVAVGILLPPTTLQQVTIIDGGIGLSPSGTSKDTDLYIGAGLSPILLRLVIRIEAGESIDVTKLLPNHLGPYTTLTLPNPSKRCHDISNILEWIRCFSAYIVVISAKQPHKVQDLL